MIRAATVLLLLATAVQAENALMRAQEQTRLDGFHESAGKALLEAFAGGARGDVDLLQEALAGAPLAPLATTLSGEWDCRTMKLGGLTALTVYAQFSCVFAPDGTAFTFEKLSGSQRTIGRVTMQDGAMIFLGVGYVAIDEPMQYGDLPAEDFGNGTHQPQIGIVEQSGPNTARILFPAPVNESEFDVLYLTRTPSVQADDS